MDYRAGEVIAMYKPRRWTSFGVVSRVRNRLTEALGEKIKVGHAGTLDPLATGVVLLCTGKATRRIEELQSGVKEYVADLKIGATTPSYDCEHDEDATYPTDHITRARVETVLRSFVGEQDQVPPVFSACKVNGSHAYHLARRGREPELRAKRVTIYEIELLAYCLPEVQIRVLCSKGTYIRALARDIGKRLESGAYLTTLRRTRVGDYTLADCRTMEQMAEELCTLGADCGLGIKN